MLFINTSYNYFIKSLAVFKLRRTALLELRPTMLERGVDREALHLYQKQLSTKKVRTDVATMISSACLQDFRRKRRGSNGAQ